MEGNEEFPPRKVVRGRERVLVKVKLVRFQIVLILSTETLDPKYVRFDTRNGPVLEFPLRGSCSGGDGDLQVLDLVEPYLMLVCCVP